jgi:hypothetical protein
MFRRQMAQEVILSLVGFAAPPALERIRRQLELGGVLGVIGEDVLLDPGPVGVTLAADGALCWLGLFAPFSSAVVCSC